MRSRSNTVTTTGPGAGLPLELAEMRERGLQARDADGETGRRHRLAAKARHEPVVAPAAADRAEAHRAAFLVLGFEGEFNFVDRAGVVFEAADDRGIDHECGRRRSRSLHKLRISNSSAMPLRAIRLSAAASC